MPPQRKGLPRPVLKIPAKVALPGRRVSSGSATDPSDQSFKIDLCWVFMDNDQHHNVEDPAQALAECEHNQGDNFVWLSLNEPSHEDMQTIADIFHINPLIVEDVVTAHQRPKVERYGNQIFMVIKSVRYSDFEYRQESVTSAEQVIETGEVQMIVGEKFIISIRHKTALPSISRQLKDQSNVTQLGPMVIAWALSDVLVDGYIAAAAELSDDVDNLEETVFTPNARISVDKIYLLKKEILEMRHAVDPLDTALRQLISANSELIHPQLQSYFRDVLDHEILVKDDIASYDERLSSLIDAAVAKISLQQNADMRTISAYVGMAAVPTLIAGIYGMNFDNMPILHTQYGYYGVLALNAIIVIGMWLAFRRQKWL